MKKIVTILLLFLIWCNNCLAQCPATVTISGIYNTTYTGSNSWIATNGFTSIPSGSDVTLDANPLTNGFVLLDVGFETQPNTTFLAVVITPCSLLGINQNTLDNSLTIFPNPVTDFLNIKANTNILKTEIFDVNGRLIFDTSQNSENVILNFSSFSKGLYLLKVFTENGIETKKIMKD